MKCVGRKKLIQDIDNSKSLEEICTEYHAELYKFVDESIKELLEPYDIVVTDFLRGTNEDRSAILKQIEEKNLHLEIFPLRSTTGKWITRIKLFEKE